MVTMATTSVLATFVLFVSLTTRVQGRCELGGWLMVPHSDPAKFYYVYGSIAMPMDCSSGTAFSPTDCACSLHLAAITGQRTSSCGGRWADQDPTLYNEVVSGSLVAQQRCPTGTRYNSATCQCDLSADGSAIVTTAGPATAAPTVRTATAPTASRAASTTQASSAVTRDDCATQREQPGKPSQYQQLVNGVWITRDCAIGTTFNTQTCTCSNTLEAAGANSANTAVPDACKGKSAVPGSSTQYKQVVAGVEYIRDCSPGTVYDEVTCECIIPSVTREPQAAVTVNSNTTSGTNGSTRVLLLDGQDANLALCEGCLIDNGYGYNPFPGDCSRYVQCAVGGTTAEGEQVFQRAQVRRCGEGLHWSQDSLTCATPANARCTQNLCSGKGDGTLVSGEFFCGSYLECRQGQGKPLCCPKGQVFSQQGGACVVSTRSCIPDCGLVTEQDLLRACRDLRPLQGDNSMYQQWVEGQGYINASCSQGLWFDPKTCKCDFIPENATTIAPNTSTTPAGCLPAANFSFDPDEDLSSVSLVGVVKENGVLRFPGNSYASLARFANYDFRDKLQVEVDVVLPSGNRSSEANQTLLANCYMANDNTQGDCYPPSIYIGLRFGATPGVDAFVLTERSGQWVSAPAITPGVATRVTLSYDGVNVSLKVRATETKKPLTGLVRRKQSTLFLGRRARLADTYFVGAVDQIKIYKCIPDV